MNILVPDSWLRDFVETKATPQKIAECLSLTSFNVEKIHKADDGDVIYEIEMTPNRGDAFSVLGIVREVYASLKSFGVEVKLNVVAGACLRRQASPASAKRLAINQRRIQGEQLQLDVKLDSKLCPHFAALILDNVVIKPSPKIIQERLEKAGIRALNNVIDVTNYIMLELGQPMHAFDYDSLATTANAENAEEYAETPRNMVLRKSKSGEEIITLDGVVRELPEGSIVIDDGEKIIDLCGVMGGENSAIDNETRRVILFAQIYDPTHIRQTSMKLQCRTEAAQRFEKGLDPEMVLPALFKAAEMLKENAGAEVASELINIRQKEFEPHTVSLTMDKLNNYLGVELRSEQIQDYLESLGFRPVGVNCYPEAANGGRRIPMKTVEQRDSSPSAQNDTVLTFEVPSWRNEDIQIEEDLIEEVARLYGYHKLPSLLPAGRPPAAVQDKKFAIERRLKYLLKDLGFTEVYTYSMVDKKQIGSQPALQLRNPLTKDLEYMRIDPQANLLTILEENKSRYEEIKIFEMANIYIPNKENELPDEKMILSALIWKNKEKHDPTGFYQIKGLAETIFNELNIKDYKFESIDKIPYQTLFDEKESAVILPTVKVKSGPTFGPIGKLAKNTWAFGLHLDVLSELFSGTKTYKVIPQFPAVKQDLAFVVDKGVLIGGILEAIKQSGGELLSNVEVFDVYQEPAAFGKDKKSVAVHLSFQCLDRSLTEKEANVAREKIEQALTKKFNAQIRKDKGESLE